MMNKEMLLSKINENYADEAAKIDKIKNDATAIRLFTAMEKRQEREIRIVEDFFELLGRYS